MKEMLTYWITRACSFLVAYIIVDIIITESCLQFGYPDRGLDYIKTMAYARGFLSAWYLFGGDRR